MFRPFFGKRLVGIAIIASWMFLVDGGSVLASSQTQLSQTINAGTLSVDIVDAGGTTVGSPSVAFSAASFSFSGQTSTGTLGVAGQKIRVSNARSAPATSWNLAIAATSGPTTTWSAGTPTMDFNDTAANGRLTVDASGGTITPTNSYTSTGLTKGSSSSFIQGSNDSVTILSASTSADQPGRWDFTGVAMTQDIPATQTPGTYTLNMTLSFL